MIAYGVGIPTMFLAYYGFGKQFAKIAISQPDTPIHWKKSLNCGLKWTGLFLAVYGTVLALTVNSNKQETLQFRAELDKQESEWAKDDDFTKGLDLNQGYRPAHYHGVETKNDWRY